MLWLLLVRSAQRLLCRRRVRTKHQQRLAENGNVEEIWKTKKLNKAHLNVFDVVVEQQLHKHWNNVLLANQYTIVLILGQDVKCADCPFDNFLHPNSVGVSTWLL